MAIQSPITSSPPDEAPCATPRALAFAVFLPLLAAFIGAERDLEDVQGAFDPAYQAWERDADIAQARMTAALGEVRRTAAVTREDRLILRMAILIDALLSAETQHGFRDLHRGMQRMFFAAFQVPGYGPRAWQVNALLIQSRHLVDALVALPLFERWTDTDLTSAMTPASDVIDDEGNGATMEFCPV